MLTADRHTGVVHPRIAGLTHLEHSRHGARWRATAYTLAAMLAFAGNSILCRLALIDAAIDAASFTSIRLASGAITLLVILYHRSGSIDVGPHGSWRSAAALFLYAICFSFAYVSLSAASGALLLFGFVQATMIVAALRAGERPAVAEWLGWLIAAGGLAWLLLPGASAPSTLGAILMAVAGVGWGLYSLYGRSEPRPLASTAGNFVRVLVPATALAVATIGSSDVSASGVLLAMLSGSVTTGLGYVAWYAALTYLSSMQAALVQLSVPAIAALGGVIIIGEALTMRLVLAGLLILGGICLALGGKFRARDPADAMD